jgi:hypothetical protein
MEDFRSMIEFGINCLRSSYPRELILSKVEIRYVDMVSPYLLGDSNRFEFVQQHLNFNTISTTFVGLELEQIQFLKRFNIDDGSALSIMVLTA